MVTGAAVRGPAVDAAAVGGAGGGATVVGDFTAFLDRPRPPGLQHVDIGQGGGGLTHTHPLHTHTDTHTGTLARTQMLTHTHTHAHTHTHTHRAQLEGNNGARVLVRVLVRAWTHLDAARQSVHHPSV